MKKILLIEDDESVREGLVELLEAKGYKVFSCVNGREGVSLAGEINPDLIICDIMMPKLNGYEVKEELDKEANTSNIPFIFLTAKADMSDFRAGMLLGADDYIIKPFDTSDLLEAINIRMDKNKKIENFLKTIKKEGGEREKKELKETDHIFINRGDSPHFIKVSKIICITAQGNDSIIHLTDKIKFEIRRALAAWDELLPSDIFRRTHRSNIINLNYVEKISNWSSGTYLIHLRGIEETFKVSQRYAKELRTSIR